MVEQNDRCTGCMACKYVCPKSAITMQENAEGFLYPHVDKSLCIECGLCEKCCPIDKPIECDSVYEQRYFAACMKDRKRRLESQSGGLCDVFSTVVVEEGNGVVYGVGFDEKWNVLHKRATDIEGIKEFKGSKYVQSNIENVYKTIISDIKDDCVGRIVITGTACQIAGVKAYLKQKRQTAEKVVFVDLICHGVPSPKIWREYLDAEGKRKNLINIKFRDKRFGWSSHVETFVYKHKKTHSKRFTKFFYMESISRKCCSMCKYASYNRESDITVADFWGYKKADMSYDSFGISECLINTQKGESFFNACHDKLNVVPISKEQCDQWNLNRPTKVDANQRKRFWEAYQNGGYCAVKDAFLKENIKNEWKLSVFYVLKSIKRLLTGK